MRYICATVKVLCADGVKQALRLLDVFETICSRKGKVAISKLVC
jgi:hypothetical protein